jgi:Co/Zn/Cd efflux system component
VLADTLGSIGVLVSFYLIKNYGLLISDPLCAMLVSVMIFVSVLPLLKTSSMSLLGQTPAHVDIQTIKDKLSAIDNTNFIVKSVEVVELNKESAIASIKVEYNASAITCTTQTSAFYARVE